MPFLDLLRRFKLKHLEFSFVNLKDVKDVVLKADLALHEEEVLSHFDSWQQVVVVRVCLLVLQRVRTVGYQVCVCPQRNVVHAHVDQFFFQGAQTFVVKLTTVKGNLEVLKNFVAICALEV